MRSTSADPPRTGNARRLHVWRKQQDLSQEELSERLGVSVATISQWERGHARPELEGALSLHLLTGGRVPCWSWSGDASTARRLRGLFRSVQQLTSVVAPVREAA